MKHRINLICLVIVALICSNCNDTQYDETFIIKGRINNSFHLASTHATKKDKQEEYLQSIEYGIIDKMDILDKYYSYLGSGKETQANEIIESDSVLSKMTEFAIAFSYNIIKMKENNTLFKPLIICRTKITNYEAKYIISISEKDLIVLKPYLEKEDVEIELIIEIIGDTEPDGTTFYKLKKINSILDNRED